MRTTKFLAGLTMSATLFFTACQKDQAETPNPNQVANNQIEALEPTDFWQGNPHKTFVVGLLQLANNNAFKSILNDKIAEQFDEDDNVLLKDLHLACANNSINFSNAIKQGIVNYNNNLPTIEHPYTQYIATSDDNSILGWINNGISYGGNNYFLQIYIPFVEKVDLESNPTIVFGLNETATTLGYKRNANNTISALIVDESYAENNLVWVVAINESVNNNGVIQRPAQPDEDAAHPSQQASHRLPGDRFVEISQVYITDKNESWYRGKAEISYSAVFMPTNCTQPNPTTDSRSGGTSIIKLSNSQLGIWQNVSNSRAVLGQPNSNSPSPMRDNQNLFLVLYEHDAVSQTRVNSGLCPGGNGNLPISTGYTSRDSHYGVRERVSTAMMSATYITLPDIYWNNNRNAVRIGYYREP